MRATPVAAKTGEEDPSDTDKEDPSDADSDLYD